jgi:hypothetical protein
MAHNGVANTRCAADLAQQAAALQAQQQPQQTAQQQAA